ncbi:MAG: class I SAM-dependent methyltransferase [Deltaproteobacteria bacterium]|nr:class I SAM-dependent methyltransferase [Deltaproteobacteria bacterium]
MNIGIQLAERRLIPNPLIRRGIRDLLRKRLAEESAREDAERRALRRFVAQMAEAPVALATDAANAQHYEVPAAFYEKVLGAQLKYSSGYFAGEHVSLDEAEEAMLTLTARRAELADGQRILELGCGWGSLTLWMARRFPNARIVAVSNSSSQRRHIQGRAEAEGLSNLTVLTVDMNDFSIDQTFDRVVSIEMFEHMRNWQQMLARIRGWLEPDGRLFLHFFAHRHFVYPFETAADDDWMGRHFFTGGMMPAADLLEHLEMPFEIEARWDVDGTHYQRTADAWASNLQRRRDELVELLSADVGRREARRLVQRWLIFFNACAELFGYENGREWLVCHYRLAPRASEV